MFILIHASCPGLGLELAAEVLRNPSLLDFLVSFLYTSVYGGRIGLMYPSTVQRSQADGTVRSFVKSDLDNDDGSSPSNSSGAATSSRAANTAAAAATASTSSTVLNDEFPAERMNLPLLKDVLDKMPSIACLQAWARGEEASSEAASDSEEYHNSAYPLDPETTNGSYVESAPKSMPYSLPVSNISAEFVSPHKEWSADRQIRERSGTMLRRKLDEVRCIFMLVFTSRTHAYYLEPHERSRLSRIE